MDGQQVALARLADGLKGGIDFCWSEQKGSRKAEKLEKPPMRIPEHLLLVLSSFSFFFFLSLSIS